MITSETPLPYLKTLKEQADTQYGCIRENFTTSQISAINKKFKQHRGMSRSQALKANPWAVINQERKLNGYAGDNCQTAEDAKERVDWITNGREFIPHPQPVEDLSITY